MQTIKGKKLQSGKNSGYTIVETMIAISVFLVVILVGTTALLNANVLHQKSDDMRSVVDSLSFAMEDISRNLRTGYGYHCIDDGNTSAIEPKSCISGKGVSFKSDAGDRIKYLIEDLNVKKSVAGGPFISLTPPEIIVDPSSRFIVSGAELSDTSQPYITIELLGTISYREVNTPFFLRTSVSQRSVDAP